MTRVTSGFIVSKKVTIKSTIPTFVTELSSAHLIIYILLIFLLTAAYNIDL